MEVINSDVEKFYFYLNTGIFSIEEAADEIGAEIMDGKLIINKHKIIGGIKIIEVRYSMKIVRE